MPNELPPPVIWPDAKGLGPCVYIATSARLQDWAVANGQGYLFKVGRSEMAPFRADTLNGRGWRTLRIDSQPCLGFDDWQLVPCIDFLHPPRARKVERQIIKRVRLIFEAFDPLPLIGERRPANGESEIFRIRSDQLDDAVAYAGTAVTNRFVAPSVQLIIAAAVAEIGRYREATAR